LRRGGGKRTVQYPMPRQPEMLLRADAEAGQSDGMDGWERNDAVVRTDR
jgi:hypothetical protein